MVERVIEARVLGVEVTGLPFEACGGCGVMEAVVEKARGYIQEGGRVVRESRGIGALGFRVNIGSCSYPLDDDHLCAKCLGRFPVEHGGAEVVPSGATAWMDLKLRDKRDRAL